MDFGRLYRDEIEAALATGALSAVLVAYSREPGVKKLYVQQKLKEVRLTSDLGSCHVPCTLESTSTIELLAVSAKLAASRLEAEALIFPSTLLIGMSSSQSGEELSELLAQKSSHVYICGNLALF